VVAEDHDNHALSSNPQHQQHASATHNDEPRAYKRPRTLANNGLSKPAAPKKKYESAKKKAASSTKEPIIPGKEYKIHVEGLPWAATIADVADFFKVAGKPLSVELPLEEDGRSSGTAFLKYSRRSELEAAMAMNGSSWPNSVRWLKIQVSIRRLSSQHAYRL
jgi:RNA recognition motif-containing protein